MSGGNRLKREELRDEVKDYLVTLREERIRRSTEVSERLRQLRIARIERQRNVRGSIAVTSAIREKAEVFEASQESFSRSNLRDRVKEMRAEVQEMLKRYKATRNDIGNKTSEIREASPDEEKSNPAEAQPSGNREIARAVEYKETEPVDAEAPAQAGYQKRLNKVVSDLAEKEPTLTQNDQDGSAQLASKAPEKGQSLMGRIRKLATGNYQERRRQKKDISTSNDERAERPARSTPTKAVTEPSEPIQQRVPVKSNGAHDRTAAPIQADNSFVKSDSVEKESAHTVVWRATEGLEGKEAPAASELLEINGIGPSVLKRLQRIGICSFQDLASTSVAKLESSFGEYARLTDLGDWVNEAKARLRNS